MDLDVRFIDTSVLCNLIDVPGRNQQRSAVRDEFNQLVREGRTRFVIPVTTIIETGNHIANGAGDRRGAARRLEEFLEAAANEDVPWQLHAVTWDAGFLDALRAGGRTGVRLLDHLGNGTMGTGDLAILCERDAFEARTSFRSVRIWTLEATMAAYA
ncbi:MAG: hypothetical protein IT196_06060 [Acidimicrobiales bacterium]|nr:hypothetical protein [Acidimicrobiales bacterium]